MKATSLKALKKSPSIITSILLALLIFSNVFVTTTYGEDEITWTNNNPESVQSNPVNPSIIKVESGKQYQIKSIMLYHYRNQGAAPGTIWLEKNGAVALGPWQATGQTGQGNVNNAYWYAYPNETLTAGTYEIKCSSPATWSQNSASKNEGIYELKLVAAEKPSASGDIGTYSWASTWKTSWGDMVLTQNGANVTGTYTHDGGKINGVVSGNQLIGTWSESPSYSPPSDAGDIIFEMSGDGKSFSGKWRYGSSGNWSDWTGSSRDKAVTANPDTKPVQPTPPTPTTPTTPTQPANTNAKSHATAFDNGVMISFPSSSGAIGYRIFRSEKEGQLGISVTDFYLTSTVFADVNVEPSTTYYYTVKEVLAEARPFDDVDEKLGKILATWTVTTPGDVGQSTFPKGSQKVFISLTLDSPKMSVNGIEQEVDPGRGTTPMIYKNRTVVPISAIVKAMGGDATWEGSSRQIGLNANGQNLAMWVDKTNITVQGQSKKIDVAPVIQNARTFVPIRFATENLNCKVSWLNSTKQIVIVWVSE